MGNAIGVAVGAVGIILESWTIAVFGGIVIAFTTAVAFGAWISQQFGPAPGVEAACESYKGSMEYDPSSWDMRMESFCGG